MEKKPLTMVAKDAKDAAKKLNEYVEKGGFNFDFGISEEYSITVSKNSDGSTKEEKEKRYRFTGFVDTYIGDELKPLLDVRQELEDVKKEIVYFDTPFFSKDLSVLWVKNNKGDIKAYELKEIVQKDNKDIQIEYLMEEIDKLKGMIKDEHNANANREDVRTSTTDGNETTREQTEDDKSTSVQRVSRSKEK